MENIEKVIAKKLIKMLELPDTATWDQIVDEVKKLKTIKTLAELRSAGVFCDFPYPLPNF